jgi:uncharacterized protein
MSKPPVRTITLGIADVHPLSVAIIRRASDLLQKAKNRYNEQGYEVQTVRISTRPLLIDLADWSTSEIQRYVLELQRIVDDLNLGYFSLGTAPAAQKSFPLTRLELLADLLIAAPVLSAPVQIATVEDGLRAEAALGTAAIIQRLAHETEDGMGNFRFAMLACVEPGSPFFPAAYHAGPTSLSVGLQGANVLTEALQSHVQNAGQAVALEAVTEWIRSALSAEATAVVEIAQQLTQELQLHFGGIDLSPAPMGPDSIVTAMELCGYGPFGTAGTLAVAAAFTTALKSIELPTCGYCGLMLPVMEDAGLGVRWEERLVSVPQLLLYSAVCGTGLDTIPLPGDSSISSLSHLLLDVATLALRLKKPLSARLFPVPGKRAGERTEFRSPYLTNTIVAAL